LAEGVRAAIHDERVEGAWDLAVAVVEEGLADEQVPSLRRLGRLGQLGELPAFIVELSRELPGPRQRARPAGAFAARARTHVCQRVGLGFAPSEIVAELLIVRRVLSRSVTDQHALDRLITECVVVYFDRATYELAHQARHDQLTGLLHHQAFVRELELELERAARYGRGVALVFVDLDCFKELNDTLGHPEGDRVLRRLAELLRDSLRASDLAGRMGGDEFAAALVEADEEAGARLLERLRDRVDELVGADALPPRCSFSAGLAHFPHEAADAEGLFRIADERLYGVKRARAA
jgi:diguanylate cyclase (GGDEF)-like protein